MASKQIEDAIQLLGKKSTDSVTGYKGVITSISVDLYGCVQALVVPGLDKEGKMASGVWLDLNRLVISKEKRVMNCPHLENPKGPEQKPVF